MINFGRVLPVVVSSTAFKAGSGFVTRTGSGGHI